MVNEDNYLDPVKDPRERVSEQNTHAGALWRLVDSIHQVTRRVFGEGTATNSLWNKYHLLLDLKAMVCVYEDEAFELECEAFERGIEAILLNSETRDTAFFLSLVKSLNEYYVFLMRTLRRVPGVTGAKEYDIWCDDYDYDRFQLWFRRETGLNPLVHEEEYRAWLDKNRDRFNEQGVPLRAKIAVERRRAKAT